MGNLVGRLENRIVTVVTASELVNVTQLNFIASQEDEAKVLIMSGSGHSAYDDDDDDDVLDFGRYGVRNFFLCLPTC